MLKENFNIKIQGYTIFHFVGVINHCDLVSVLGSENCRLDNIETQVINNYNSIQFSVYKGESQFIIAGVCMSHCYNTNQFIISFN